MIVLTFQYLCSLMHLLQFLSGCNVLFHLQPSISFRNELIYTSHKKSQIKLSGRYKDCYLGDIGGEVADIELLVLLPLRHQVALLPLTAASVLVHMQLAAIFLVAQLHIFPIRP